MNEKKLNTVLRGVLFVLKSILKIVIYAVIVLFIMNLCKEAFSFGYAVLNQRPIAQENGMDVTVEIPVGATVAEIGQILEENGLIEDAGVFILQELLSNYHGKLQPGTFVLNTAQTPDEMIRILGTVAEEDEE